MNVAAVIGRANILGSWVRRIGVAGLRAGPSLALYGTVMLGAARETAGSDC